MPMMNITVFTNGKFVQKVAESPFGPEWPEDITFQNIDALYTIGIAKEVMEINIYSYRISCEEKYAKNTLLPPFPYVIMFHDVRGIDNGVILCAHYSDVLEFLRLYGPVAVMINEQAKRVQNLEELDLQIERREVSTMRGDSIRRKI